MLGEDSSIDHFDAHWGQCGNRIAVSNNNQRGNFLGSNL
jgi:hypothetical protein